jgi:twitching motility protein PilT
MNLTRLIEGLFKVRASDLHLKVGISPLMRVNGRLTSVKHPPITPEEMQQVVSEILPNRLLSTFEKDGAADFAYDAGELGRCRVAAFHQRGFISITFRRINPTPPTIEELMLPSILNQVCDVHRGMILVTGITGSGKSSTLAAMMQILNSKRRSHIVTVEDPIEYVFKDGTCLVNQMEIGPDCPSFAVAMRRILRFDPDIIMIGEMRDRETVTTAIEAVDTGHLVFSTLHTSDAKQTINRVLHFFAKHEEEMILELLAHNLRAIVSQRLLPRDDQPGLVPVCELLINTPIIYKLIMEGRVADIDQILKGGEKGMQNFDLALALMVRTKLISIETALENCHDESGVRRMIRGEFSAGDRAGIVG